MSQISTGEFKTSSAEETFELAYRIGEALDRSAVFLLHGDLGAGKTVFAKGLGAGLEIDPAEISSPTFTLINRYDGRMRMYHLDLYRIEGGPYEVGELGLDEMLNEERTVIVIEWSERLGAFAIPEACRVTISDLGAELRAIRIS